MLAACATRPESIKPGGIEVQYSQAYPDGTWLKEIPTEVTIVRRQATVNNVAGQVALNLVMLALGGGVGVQAFDKNGLRGVRIEDAATRVNLKNPVAGEFLSRLQGRLDAAVREHPQLRDGVWQKPVLVAGGSVRLVYETLSGDAEERFRLKNDLVIYKSREKTGLLTFSRPVMVDCRDESAEPLPQEEWARDDYRLIKLQLDAMLAACETKVLAQVPVLFGE